MGFKKEFEMTGLLTMERGHSSSTYHAKQFAVFQWRFIWRGLRDPSVLSEVKTKFIGTKELLN